MPRRVPRRIEEIALLGVLALLAAGASARAAADQDTVGDAVAKGAYLATAADCVACHTDSEHHGRTYAGGRAIPTPFGTFYSPNITPDPESGIGGWSNAQFLRALHDGVGPDGGNYFPVFPYPSFTRILDSDALALKAYLFSLPPVRQRDRPNDVWFPFSWRFLQTFWKWLFFTPGRFHPQPGRSEAYNRGAYLVTALAHCGECHTPRNWFGAMEGDRFLAGTKDGPNGKPVPNITPDAETGIGKWSEDDIVGVLADGHTPDFDFVGGAMAEIVKSTSQLTEADRRAIAVYLKSVAPVSTPELK